MFFRNIGNSSKYVFSLPKSGIGMSYTPYLNKLSRDIFLANLSYYRKGNRSAWGSSFRYFSIGAIQQTQLFGSEIYRLGSFLPSEWLLDFSYAKIPKTAPPSTSASFSVITDVC